MFKLTSNYILGALAVFAYVSFASAVPSQLEARDIDAAVLTICTETGFAHCIKLSIASSACRSFVGGIAGYDKEVSSAKIPDGFNCTFYRAFSCLSKKKDDKVTLQGGDYPNFSKLPDDKGDINFDDAASSVICSTIRF